MRNQGVRGVAVLLVCWLAASAAHALTRDEVMASLEPLRGQTVTDLTLAGNHVTKDWVIAREIWTEVGDPLDLETVGEDIVRLENLAIFGSVIVTATPQAGGVALNYAFTEMPWIIPFPALSYTEENGFSVGLGVASPNFLGRKMSLSASFVVGGTTTYKFKGENPWITGNHVSGGFEAWHQTRPNQLLDFRQTSDMVALNGGTYLGETGRLKFHGGYYGVGSDKDGITLSSRNHDDLWHGGVSLGNDSRDSWRAPREGWKNELAVLYLGGDANTLAVDFDVNFYLPLSPGHTLASGPLLSFQSGDVGEEIPSYMQYFLGGANSVRGYKLEELGKELFGKNQLLYNLEYRWNFLPVRALKIFKWSFGVGLQAAAFGDVGVVWDRSQDFSLDRTRAGFGAGLRLLLPGMEMMRFDVGMGQDGDVVFNFGVNSIFFGRKQRVR